MRNSKFLRELENDNVDSEIVSEELRCFQDDDQPRSVDLWSHDIHFIPRQSRDGADSFSLREMLRVKSLEIVTLFWATAVIID